MFSTEKCTDKQLGSQLQLSYVKFRILGDALLQALKVFQKLDPIVNQFNMHAQKMNNFDIQIHLGRISFVFLHKIMSLHSNLTNSLSE